ncbi:60S ribosome subunit biogenesis protein NIP7, putative [Babesia bigemina]|uniref:60S ribosome subunit biogenesis protein NIP7 homolog n=1 Tax=Babesia bigemina TaxID=5866 RepID=A0A061D7V0_BABBI|nr:60S ribosome subunit biogenesis protein NIP7, putative [Babesia bigemina]CDR94989.1 60S ribosome subunit biogenesis protein NIP7, putative [Babesia bigemina]|eukprot:XP_012767175.1 60S ribosome subunit biogenesis protein NIP7, putative [Babesia bigemina]
MRPLSEDEAQLVFKKLATYIGEKVLSLVDAGDSGPQHVLRLHRERVYYMNEAILKYSGCINHKNLISAGVCLGKFTKAKHFRLHITALHYMAHYSKSKVWLKSGEQSFVYGNNVAKKHIGQMSEDVPQNGGVVVMYNNLPLGFGVTSKSTEALKTALPDDVAVFHQADIGEYLRHEAEII